MIKNKDVTIKKLPYDDSIYLVIKYGYAVKMNIKSRMPNIQVVLRKVDLINQLPIVGSKDIIVYLAMNELDVVRLGTLWKKQKLLNNSWTNYNGLMYDENLEFTFDFNERYPFTLSYCDTIYELNNSLEDIYKLNLPNTNKSDINRIELLKETKYVKLIDSQGIVVLIPCMELFISTYTPESKGIKERLLQYDLDTAIEKFLHVEECYIEDDKYIVNLKMNNLGYRNVSFLAYMKLNNISRQRVKKLWNSLEFNQNKFDYKYPVRFPNVLPYHPNTLKIKVDGLWLNEKVFLVFRIDDRNLPNEIKIKSLYKNIDIEVSEEGEKYCNSKPKEESENEPSNNDNEDEENKINVMLETENMDLELDSGNETSKRNYTQKILSEVGLLGSDVDITYQVIHEQHTITREQLIEDNEKGENIGESENHSNHSIQTSPKTAIDLSSSENNSNDDNEVLHLHVETQFNCEETKHLFESVVSALELLKKEESNFGFQFLDSDFSTNTNLIKTTFFDTLIGDSKVPKVDSWYRLKQRKENKLVELGYREYLLAKITWNEITCFLLEIGKKDGEGFSGLVFHIKNIKDMSNSLHELLEKVVEQRGIYSKRDNSRKVLTPIKLPVKYETYKHLIKKSTKYLNLDKKIKEKIEVLYDIN